MGRIQWLDASRGLAVLLLIVMHYVGALESRNFISMDVLDVFYGVLRLATPFFMFTFGVAFYITASRKIAAKGITDYYKNNVVKRVFYILLGREVIVLILAFRYPEMAENLGPILLFQEFAKGGEILIFYFFAFLIAPLNVMFLNRYPLHQYLLFWILVYAVSFYIGFHYVDGDSNNALRFLFYDIYAFFPFMSVVALAMLIAKYYQQSHNQAAFLKQGLLLSVTLVIAGFMMVNYLSDIPWRDLANAKFKKPPNLAYMSFYLGEVLLVISLVALLFSSLPGFIASILSVIGRNTLVCYVLHYAFYFSVPLASLLGGGAVKELAMLVLIMLVSYIGVMTWDRIKRERRMQALAS